MNEQEQTDTAQNTLPFPAAFEINQEAIEALRQAANQVVEALAALWQEFVESEPVQAFVAAIGNAAQHIYATIWNSYTAAGAPYGENHEGMMRWLRELGEIARLYREAEEIADAHRFNASIRRMLEEKHQASTT